MSQPGTPETTSVSNLGASYVRTFVGIGVGTLLTWLGRRWHVVLDGDSSQAAAMGATAVVTGASYAVVRALESKWKGFGWLLGLATKPKYAPVAAPPETPAR
jgi:hypothetical protein